MRKCFVVLAFSVKAHSGDDDDPCWMLVIYTDYLSQCMKTVQALLQVSFRYTLHARRCSTILHFTVYMIVDPVLTDIEHG